MLVRLSSDIDYIFRVIHTTRRSGGSGLRVRTEMFFEAIFGSLERLLQSQVFWNSLVGMLVSSSSNQHGRLRVHTIAFDDILINAS